MTLLRTFPSATATSSIKMSDMNPNTREIDLNAMIIGLDGFSIVDTRIIVVPPGP